MKILKSIVDKTNNSIILAYPFTLKNIHKLECVRKIFEFLYSKEILIIPQSVKFIVVLKKANGNEFPIASFRPEQDPHSSNTHIIVETLPYYSVINNTYELKDYLRRRLRNFNYCELEKLYFKIW